MRDPDGMDLKQLENDLEALEERLKVYDDRKILLPWEKKAKEALQQEISDTQWAIVGAKECVFSNKYQLEVYQNQKNQPAPESEDKRSRVDQLMASRKIKMKMAKIKR